MSIPIHPLIARAATLAHEAHAGQERDDGGGPYIHHPARVAATLATHFPEDAALIAAAWCHDVLEDCPQITPQQLRFTIGDDAFALVEMVTNPSKQHPDLPRAERKAMDREHIATISLRAKYIKLADRTDNLMEGARSPDKAWIATYVAESYLLGKVLRGTHAELEALFDAALVIAHDAST